MRYILFTFLFTFSFFSYAQEDTEPMTEEKKQKMILEQEEFNKYNTNIQRVKDSIFMIYESGGNIGVSIGEDGVLLIDSKFSENTPSIISNIRQLTSKQIKYLVNTHHHGDHTGGNKNFKEMGVITFAHQNARGNIFNEISKDAQETQKRVFDSIRAAIIASGGRGEKADIGAKEGTKELEDYLEDTGRLPQISFNGSMTLHVNGEKIMLVYIKSAHTNGDLIVYFTKSNVIHTGDAFVNNTYPFIDTDNGGSLEGYMSGLNQIMNYSDDETKIIPGHGKIASKKDVKYTLSMLEFLKNRVAYYVVGKKTEAEILSMKEITKEYDDKGFGDGFITRDKFVSKLYEEALKRYPSAKNR